MEQGRQPVDWDKLLSGLTSFRQAKYPQPRENTQNSGTQYSPGGVQGPNNLYESRRSYFNEQGDFGGFNNLLKAVAQPGLNALFSSGGISAPLAYKQLSQLLLNKGQIDPQAMNWQLNDISRATHNAQRDYMGQTAAGLGQGSGVAQAMQGAIGQGGLDRRARVMAEETKEAENRRRADLMLFQQMLMEPMLRVLGIERGADAAEGQGGNAWDSILGLLGGGLTAASSAGLFGK